MKTVYHIEYKSRCHPHNGKWHYFGDTGSSLEDARKRKEFLSNYNKRNDYRIMREYIMEQWEEVE